MKVPCQFCKQPIDTRGMTAHIHFRHRDEVLAAFRCALAAHDLMMVARCRQPKALRASPPEIEHAA